MDQRTFRFDELVALEPGLLELEERVQAVEDSGSGSFFCSNHVWLPLASTLRELIGVGRPGWSSHAPDDPLYDSRAFEVCYVHLSCQMPPCRNCGCQGFEPWRERQLDQRRS